MVCVMMGGSWSTSGVCDLQGNRITSMAGFRTAVGFLISLNENLICIWTWIFTVLITYLGYRVCICVHVHACAGV